MEQTEMVRFFIRGLTINVVSQDPAAPAPLRALMIGATPPMREHLRSLFARTDQVQPTNDQFPPIKSGDIPGRWRGAVGRERLLTAWDLTDVRLVVRNATDGLTVDDSIPSNLTNPSPEFPDWSSLHWVPDAKHLLPGATLKTEYRDLGGPTRAIAEFHGGTLRGGTPDGLGGDYVWCMRQELVQAMTDTLVCECLPPAGEVLRVDVYDPQDRPLGAISLKDGTDVWLVNAPNIQNGDVLKDPPRLLHLHAFFEAFDDRDHSADGVKGEALYSYQRGEPPVACPVGPLAMSGFHFDVGYCFGGLVRE
jgi:hypothetical protein